MPRRKRIKHFEVPGQPRFLTFSCYHRLPLFSNDQIKDVFVQRLMVARAQTRFSLHAWVIMPEHVHLLLVPQLPQLRFSSILSAIKRPFAEQVLTRWRHLRAPIILRICNSHNRLCFWQPGPGYDRNVRDDNEYLEKFDYIHNNPAKRELVDRITDWPWSSARWYAGHADALIDLDVG